MKQLLISAIVGLCVLTDANVYRFSLGQLLAPFQEAKVHASVAKFLAPPADPAYHLEITN